MVELMVAVGIARPEIESAGGAVTVRFRPILYVAPIRVRHDMSYFAAVHSRGPGFGLAPG